MVALWQSFVLDSITTKPHIVIFKKNKNCQTKHIISNIFTNISRVTITVFATGRSQYQTMLNQKSLLRQKELYWHLELKTYVPFGFNEHAVYAT